MKPISVVLLLVVLFTVLPGAASAQGPLPPGWEATKFVPTQLDMRGYYLSLGWELVGSTYQYYKPWGRVVQGYLYRKWIAAPTNGVILVPAYSLYESQCQSMGRSWHYDWQLRRCVIKF
jgi:hypothetical protein